MKNIAVVVVLALVALAAGVYIGRSEKRRIDSDLLWLHDEGAISIQPWHNGIAVWRLKDGKPIEVRSYSMRGPEEGKGPRLEELLYRLAGSN